MAFKTQVNDENFYSSLAAEVDEESSVSDADVAVVSKMLADMDDMDDDLFTSSLKPHKGSSRASSRASRDSDASPKDSRPASRMSTATSKDASPRIGMDKKGGTTNSSIIEEENDLNSSLTKGILDSPDKISPPPSPVARRQRGAKPQPKKFDFGDFDEDDPLAGLLSDDEDDLPKKKAPPKKKPPPKKQEEQPSPRRAKTKDVVDANLEDKKGLSNKEEASPKGGRGIESGRQSTAATAKKKADEVDFGDDDLLDTMGFDETPRVEKKKTDADTKEKEAAQAKVNELFGKTTNVKDKPPAGKKKEFVLDKKYIKSEPKKEEPKEEDFIFGDYTPSSVAGRGRPESAPPPRRSVRFEDTDDDNIFGTSTFSRPRSRGRMKPTQDDAPRRPHSSADTRRRSSDADSTKPNDDWLELALGSDAKGKDSEKKPTASKTDGGKSGEGSKKESAVVEKKEAEKKAKPVVSAADYLGLAGDDIDPDTLSSTQPSTPRGQSSSAPPKGQDLFTTPTKRETTSPFPWDSPGGSPRKGQPSGDLGQTDQPSEIKGMLADDFDDDDDDGKEAEPLQTSLMAQQIAQLQKMQEQGVTTATTTPASAQKQDIQPKASSPQPASQPSSRAIQPQELGVQQQQIGKVPASTAPSSSKQSSTTRPEPKWRQELRQRQQDQQQQPSPIFSPAQSMPPQPDLSRPTAQSQNTGMGPAITPSSISSVPTVMGASEDLMKQMQLRQQELDAAMQKQQEQWLAQQQEQMRQLQETRQQAMQQQMQQQMQMQQMMMNSSKIQNSSPFSTLPFSTSATMPSVASLSLDAKIQQLEMEKKLVELQLETMQQKHQQQMNAVEGAHKDYVQLLEESSKRRETRLHQENVYQTEQYETRLQQMNNEKAKLEETCQQRLQQMSQDHMQQIDRVQQGHRQAVDILQRQHQEELQQVQQSLKQELENVTSTQSHSRSLQAVVDQVHATSRELDHLQTRVHGQHQTQIDERLHELKQKDDQLKVLEKRLAQQQEETSAERVRLEGLVNRLEGHIQQQNAQLDEERWRLRQEQSKLASLQKAAEEERRITAEQMASQHATLQHAKDAVLNEQKSIMAQCLEERKSLAMERAQVAATRRELEAALQQQADKAMQVKAEQEGKLESLASERSQLTVQAAALKQQQQSLEEEKQKLREQQEQVDTEKRRLQQLAETLRKKSQQIQDTIHEAVSTRNEGELALDRARKAEAEHINRQRNIQHQIQILRATEKHIAQERLELAQEQRKLERLRKCVRCKQCGIPVPMMQPSDSTINIMPVNTTSAAIPGSPEIHSTPQAHSRGDSRRGLQEVIAKVEMDTSIHMWKAAAEKDKEFLEEESAYLETLRSPIPASMRVQ